jgi:hypothetical protein
MVRDEPEGDAIAVEVWEIPSAEVGSLLVPHLGAGDLPDFHGYRVPLWLVTHHRRALAIRKDTRRLRIPRVMIGWLSRYAAHICPASR